MIVGVNHFRDIQLLPHPRLSVPKGVNDILINLGLQLLNQPTIAMCSSDKLVSSIFNEPIFSLSKQIMIT